jgi:hypothetical protein
MSIFMKNLTTEGTEVTELFYSVFSVSSVVYQNKFVPGYVFLDKFGKGIILLKRSIMLSNILLAILSLTRLSSDTVEVQGTRGIFYRAFVNQDTLYFQYKTGNKWFDPMVIDNGDVASPSMAISSGNYLHIVWCNSGRVYYITTLEPITRYSIIKRIPPQLSPKMRLSTFMPQTEPASDLFIEARGDTVFIQWYSPGGLGDVKEKWRRKRWISEPYYEWSSPVNYTIKKSNLN